MVVACFGDSITDGTASTLNGDDRWPDVLSRRLHEKYGVRVSVVNAGIGGNRVVSPVTYSTASPVPGGPSALERFDRDVAGLSGLSAVIWLEGINDLAVGTKADAIIAGMREIVSRSRARGLRIFGATIVSSLGSATAHGTPEVDAERQAINAFIRTEGAFDGVVDFDLATRDPRDRRPAPALSAQQHDRWTRRSPASEPGGVSGDGKRRRHPPAGTALRRAVIARS